MTEDEAKTLLVQSLNFSSDDMNKLKKFEKILLEYNSRYNLISKFTEKSIWSRHILDSAQLIKYISTNSNGVMADFGSGAGFPGLIIAIFNKNPEFHVKLYEKSPVKRDFLSLVKKNLKIDYEIKQNIYDDTISADTIVSRAFKKLDEIIKISRETVKKPHKLIILKGKNAQAEINNVSLNENYSYKMKNSITNSDSKIVIFKVR
jgi:16S rRNA (guanine527-N7)-methyltransferase